ncbi:MAG: T9SS type A sorting domain-containing protein, partial [Bacteroidales bacterium]|nr:T9SS type A sorting domain-containing protein [Bacteroidales bacterium]
EVSFTNTSTDASSYLWDFGDGATDIAENPVYTYVSGGSYSVVLTAYSEYCGEVSNTQTVDITTGISSIDFGDLAKIYPNPSTGIFYFEANDLLKDELIVKIVDVNGRVVYENYHITESLEKINLSNYAQGIYFIQLRSDKYSGTEKIVIE